MSHQQVAIPIAMRPLAQLSRFLFRTGRGDWVYKSIGALVSMGERIGNTNVFGEYVPTADDIIIACHSRSGTHWMMQIALQIAHLGQADYDYIYDMVAWPDFLPGVAIRLSEHPPSSPTGYRLIKTHAPADSVPYNEVAKYISVIRDPKDVLVSMYYWAPQAFAFLGLRTGTPEDWIDKFIKQQIPGGWWATHTASWWALRDKPNVHVVMFNAMKSDPATEIERIREFLQVELSPSQYLQVIEKSSFQYMKAINHKFSPIIGKTAVMDIVREGKTGSGSALFTQGQLARVDAFCKRELQHLGSDFPYDEMFA